jgi:FkbM family methyltransferase
MGLKIDIEDLIKKYELKFTGIIHVGAHEGQEVDLYERIGVKNIMLFEPIPKIFDKLKNKYYNNYLVFETALGNFNGEVMMNIENSNDCKSSSILEPFKHINYYPNIVFTEKINIKITKLDNFLSFSNKFNVMVIDTQGYELEVLKGGEKFLEKIDNIICEVNNEELYLGCPNVNEIDEYLKKFGFTRVETSWSWDNGTWGDALYIKNK